MSAIDELRAKSFRFPTQKGDAVPQRAYEEPLILSGDIEPIITAQEQRIGELEARVAELEGRIANALA